jgi:hypothetical protein
VAANTSKEGEGVVEDRARLNQSLVRERASARSTLGRVAVLEHTARRAADNTLLPHNMISNSFMSSLVEGKPAGFQTNKYPSSSSQQSPGEIKIEAAHPYTKGFEGPYCDVSGADLSNVCPQRAVAIDEATEATPWVFGRYDKGERVQRGGLGNGWGGHHDGHILKIVGRRNHGALWVSFAMEKRSITRRILFRGYIKIIKGKASVQSDIHLAPRWNRSMTEAAPDGWLAVHELIDISHISDMGFEYALTFGCFGEEEPGSTLSGEFEIYLVLPYIANIVESRDDGHSAHWQASVIDNRVDTGVAAWSMDGSTMQVNTFNSLPPGGSTSMLTRVIVHRQTMRVTL